MKKIYTNILWVGCFTIMLTSCKREFAPFVDTPANVYKQLSMNQNGEIDSMVKKIETIKEFQELEKPLKILNTSDEMKILSAMIDVSLEGDINIDSLQMTSENTIFLQNNNNISPYAFTKSITEVEKGYKAEFMRNSYSYSYSTAAKIWKYASENYISTSKYDSITAEEKIRIEEAYPEHKKVLQELKYVVLVEDALVVPPVIDKANNGFVSGYVLTHLYAFDISSLEKVGQMMTVASNSDEISYYSFSKGSGTSSLDEASISNKLRSDLVSQKRKTIDSIFNFSE